MGIPAWVPAVCNVECTLQKMAAGTLLICLISTDQELSSWNAMTRKVDALITEDCMAMVKEIVAQLGIGQNAVQEMRKTNKCRRVGNHSCFNDMLPKEMTFY
jgi:hypothetical protein